MTGQLWGITTTTLQVRIKLQLNTILFQKTLVRKDIASSNPDTPKAAPGADADAAAPASGDDATTKADELEWVLITCAVITIDPFIVFVWIKPVVIIVLIVESWSEATDCP